MSTDAPTQERTAPLGAALEWIGERAWIVAWWAGGRIVVLASAVVVGIVGPRGYLATDERAHPFGVLGAWDGRWYRMIASHGYLLIPGRQSDPAFFPLYPLLLRAGHAVGFGYETAGLLISNVAFLAALFAFEALSRELFGASLARRATVYLTVFPLGYVFSMSYPEGVVLGAIAMAGLAAMRGRWLTAAVFAAAAALARPEGLLVALPVLAIAWHRRRDASPLQRGLALGAVLAPAAALASFPLYLGFALHDPFAWSEAEKAWGRHFSPFGFVGAVTHLPKALAQNPGLTRDVVFLAVYLVLLVAARRAGTPRAWLTGAAVIILLPLFSGSFESIGRFGLLALPVFWGLAWIGRHPVADRGIRIASVVLLVAATVTIPFVFP
jgi:hypothetical protein